MKRIITFLFLGIIFGCKDTPPGPDISNDSIKIIKPENNYVFWEGDSIPCKVETVNIPHEDVLWKINDTLVNCIDNDLIHNFSPRDYQISAYAKNNKNIDDAVSITIKERVAPAIKLTVKLPRPDLEPQKSLEIADGEAVIISWEVSNNPDTCITKGDWSKNVSSNKGSKQTNGLKGPDNLVFTMSCMNEAGHSKESVNVNVAVPGEKYSMSDRPNDKGGVEQVKVLYILPKDKKSRDLDILKKGEGGILDDINAFQEWFMSETSGKRFRINTYNDGNPDITRIRLHQTISELDELGRRDLNRLIRSRLTEAGFNKKTKKYLIYYDGHFVQQRGSGGGGHAFIYLRQDYHHNPPADLAVRPIAVHELAHTMGIVHPDAPNIHDDGSHVSYPCPKVITPGTKKDLMCTGTTNYSKLGVGHPVLDYGRNDYYNDEHDKGDLPEGVTNLANSPWLFRP